MNLKLTNWNFQGLIRKGELKDEKILIWFFFQNGQQHQFVLMLQQKQVGFIFHWTYSESYKAKSILYATHSIQYSQR